MKLPRKLKKAYLGVRMSKSKLRKLIASIKITPSGNGRDSAVIEPYDFCPGCGCQQVNYTHNRASYPERWVSGYCARCGYHVIESDNSPYYHALEMPDLKIY